MADDDQEIEDQVEDQVADQNDQPEPEPQTTGSTQQPAANAQPDPRNLVPYNPQQEVSGQNEQPDPRNLVPVEPNNPEGRSATGVYLRNLARGIIPGIAGAAGMVVGGVAGSEIPVAGTIAGGLAGGMAASYWAKKGTEAVSDALGLDSPESRAADEAAHPTAAFAGDLTGGLAGFSPTNASGKIALRVASGLGGAGINLAGQAASKGIDQIDPTEAIIAGGAAAAFPNVNRLAGGAAAGVMGGAARAGLDIRPSPYEQRLKAAQNPSRGPQPAEPSQPPTDDATNAGRPLNQAQGQGDINAPLSAHEKHKAAMQSPSATSDNKGTAQEKTNPDKAPYEYDWRGKGPDPRGPGGYRPFGDQQGIQTQPLSGVTPDVKAVFDAQRPLPPVPQGPPKFQLPQPRPQQPPQVPPLPFSMRPGQGPQMSTQRGPVMDAQRGPALPTSTPGAAASAPWAQRGPTSPITPGANPPPFSMRPGQGPQMMAQKGPTNDAYSTPPLSPSEVLARRAQLAATPAPPMVSDRGNVLAPQASNIRPAEAAPPAAPPEEPGLGPTPRQFGQKPSTLEEAPPLQQEVPGREVFGQKPAPPAPEVPAQEPVSTPEIKTPIESGSPQEVGAAMPARSGMEPNRQASGELQRERPFTTDDGRGIGDRGMAARPDRLKRYQNWDVGSQVNVGYNRGLTVTAKNPDGSFTLQSPKGKTYNFKAHQGLVEETSPLVREAAAKAAEDIVARRPQSLSAGAGEGAATYGEGINRYAPKGTAPPGERRATLGGIWKSANDKFDNLFGIGKLAKYVFAPHTISNDSATADRIIRYFMGNTKAQAAQFADALGQQRKYFNSLTPEESQHFAENFENGTIAKNHPAWHAMDNARKVSDSLEQGMKAAGATDNYTKVAMPQLFAKKAFRDDGTSFDQRTDMRNWIQNFKDENGRLPTMGDALKRGYLLDDHFVKADGTPDLMRLMAQNQFQKHLAIERANIMRTATEGIKADPKTQRGAIDPVLSPNQDSRYSRPLDKDLTNGVPLYAAPETKAVLERYFKPTIQDPTYNNAYNAYMGVKNATNAWDLFGGIYHMRFMLQESAINEMSRGMARLAAGNVGGIKDILRSPDSFVTLYKEGKNKVLDAMLHPENVTDTMDRMTLQYLKNGGQLPPVRLRGMGITPELETEGAISGFADGWKDAWKDFARDTVQRALKTGNKFSQEGALAGSKAVAYNSVHTISDFLQATMHPLFNRYIPLLKAGANFRNMKQYLIDNPGLGDDHYNDMARKFVNNTDNAMGELNQSTLYAPGWLKAIGNGSTVSLGWNIGDVKQFLGGGRQLIRDPSSFAFGKNYDPRVSYIPAMMAVTALSNIAYQLYKIQEGPRDLADVAFPRTGGKTKLGNPERAIMPGYEKDVAEGADMATNRQPLGNSVMHWAYGKLAALPQTAIDTLLYNQNFAKKQIHNPNDGFASMLTDYLGYAFHKMLTPIMAQQYFHEEKNPNTNIGPIEKFLGNKHAPREWEDRPQELERQRKANDKAAKDAKKFHQNTGY